MPRDETSQIKRREGQSVRRPQSRGPAQIRDTRDRPAQDSGEAIEQGIAYQKEHDDFRRDESQDSKSRVRRKVANSRDRRCAGISGRWNGDLGAS